MPLGSSADVKWRNAPGNTPTMRHTAGGLAPAGALSALAGGGIQSAGAPGAAIGLDPSGTCMLICLLLRRQLLMLYVLLFKFKNCLSVMREVVRVIRKLSVLILALYRRMLAFGVLSIWGVLVFLSIIVTGKQIGRAHV